MGPAHNCPPDTEYAPSWLRRGRRNATQDGRRSQECDRKVPKDILWVAETSPHDCHDSRFLLLSACSALLGQSGGSVVSCANSPPMHRVCSRSRTASMQPKSPSGLPTLHSTSAAPTDTVPDRNTSSEPDKLCPALHGAALHCTAALLQPRWLQLIVTQLCHSALPS